MRSRKPKITGTSLRHALREFVWPRWKLVTVGLGLITINRLSGLALPWSTKQLVDDFGLGGDQELGALLIGGLIVAITLQAITSFALTILLSVEAEHLIADLRGQVQQHVLRLPVRVFDNTNSGQLVSRIMEDVIGVRNLVGTGLVQFVGGIVTAVVAFVFVLQIHPVLTVAAIGPLLAFGVAATWAFRKLRPAFRERGRIRAEVTGRLTEALGGIRIIKGFHAVEREVEIFHEGVMRIFDNAKSTLTTSSGVRSLGSFFVGLASVMILGFGALLMSQGELTPGEFISFSMFMGFMISPVVQMAGIGTQMTEALAGLDRTAEVLSWSQEDEDPGRTVTMPAIEGHLRFDDVHFRYQEDKPVLRGVSFEALPGTVVALVGSSGSGKSTIASLAATFLDPDGGRVLVDGFDLRRVVLPSYRSQLGLVLQEDFLFEGTIRDNLRFARTDATDEEVERAADTAHVTEFAERFPDGLDTVVGERGVKLSGGQRQRVTIARALLADPRILILDEATSSLDTESEALIQKSLTDLLAGRTTLVIAHRLSTIQRADLILVVEDGEIVERGSHDELLSAGGRYAELYTIQARI